MNSVIAPIGVANFLENLFVIMTEHTPSDLVVDHWTSGVESNSLLAFLLRHALWTPFGRLMSCKMMSCKILSRISVPCDFTTQSGGIWGGGHLVQEIKS